MCSRAFTDRVLARRTLELLVTLSPERFPDADLFPPLLNTAIKDVMTFRSLKRPDGKEVRLAKNASRRFPVLCRRRAFPSYDPCWRPLLICPLTQATHADRDNYMKAERAASTSLPLFARLFCLHWENMLKWLASTGQPLPVAVVAPCWLQLILSVVLHLQILTSLVDLWLQPQMVIASALCVCADCWLSLLCTAGAAVHLSAQSGGGRARKLPHQHGAQ
jgi:hypothetical protein